MECGTKEISLHSSQGVVFLATKVLNTTAQKLCLEALSLPRQSRVEIAERLLASLEDKTDSKAERSWKAVIRRRRGDPGRQGKGASG
jgi:hypothetical protein